MARALKTLERRDLPRSRLLRALSWWPARLRQLACHRHPQPIILSSTQQTRIEEREKPGCVRLAGSLWHGPNTAAFGVAGITIDGDFPVPRPVIHASNATLPPAWRAARRRSCWWPVAAVILSFGRTGSCFVWAGFAGKKGGGEGGGRDSSPRTSRSLAADEQQFPGSVEQETSRARSPDQSLDVKRER